MKKFTIIFLFITALLSFGFHQGSRCQMLLDENFSYPADDLITAHGWTAHSGGGTQPITVYNGGLTFPGYLDSGIGNAALVDNNGEDDNKAFATQSSGTVYVAFMVNVTSTAAGYFFHLGGTPIGTTFRGKLFMDATNHFGVSVGSNTGTFATSTYTLGTTYLLVLKYQIVSGTTNDAVSLYIFNTTPPSTEPATPTIGPLTDATQSDINPGCVAIRQFSATQNLIIDGIRVGMTWNDVFNPAPTPTNYPTNFTANTAPFTVNLSWTDATGGQLPLGYLVLGSNADNIVLPVDGVPVADDPNLADGSGALNVLQGAQSAVFGNLPSNTTYYFKIFPYTNTGPFIKYKTNGTPPSATATTGDYVMILQKDFQDQTFDPWDTISVSSNKGWIITSLPPNPNYYAYINGFGGSGNSEDWLISPSINFDAFQDETLTFMSAYNYVGPPLEVKISNDYITGAMPSTGTWVPLTATLSPGGWVWTPSGNVDLSTISGNNVHVAFKYVSGTTTGNASAWEVDDIKITGKISLLATVSTNPNFTNITPYAATGSGNVTNDGGATITARGLCYATLPNPSVAGDHTTETGTIGVFTSNLTGLSPNTLYYVRAYATNINGTAYGDMVTFTTLCEPYAPIVDFTSDVVSIMMGESVNFFDASAYCPTYWKWSFVGGWPMESYVQNPTGIVYNYPGDYAVCLDVSNQYGYASDCKMAYIHVIGPTNAKIVITEIMYNPPEHGTDTLEFIEVYNNDYQAWNLNNFYFSLGVTYTFPDVTINPGAYLLVAKSATAMHNTFNVDALQWTEGALSNTGEPIVIKDNLGFLVDTVYYGVTLPWDTLANGYGPSLELCDPNTDNNNPANWRHAFEFQALNTAGDSIWASPLQGCSYPPIAGFTASDTAIVQYEYVTFTDASSSTTTSWEWTFEGGTPGTFSGKTPPPIQYNSMGAFDVILKAINNAGHNTLLKTDYIEVGLSGISSNSSHGFNVYPNPNNGTFKIVLPGTNPCIIKILNQLGETILEKTTSMQVNLFEQAYLAPGLYIIQMKDELTNRISAQKLIIQ